MNYLFDTNVVSELRKAKAGRANPNLTAWAKTIPPHDLYLSVLVIMEIETGILKLERNDKTQARLLRSWLDQEVIPSFSSRILNVDINIAGAAPNYMCPMRVRIPMR